ncbi:MAG: MASE3 domain-containing protein [Promethearchaeota archaeon]
MSDQQTRKNYHIDYYIFVLILILIYLTNFYSYLLFHNLAELFSIVIKVTIFAILYNSREHIDNNFFLVVGLSFIFIGFIDLIHTLAYPGMNIFIGYDTNLPAQLWIAARYLQSISLLIASLVLNKKVNAKYYLLGFTFYTAILIILIFLRLFPVCYIEGSGLTPFKVISEYIIDIILVITLLIMYRNRLIFDFNIFILLIFSIILTIVSELAFTFYISAFDISNLIGHILKIPAFFLLYKAIISIGLRNPIDLLYRKLKLSEKRLLSKTIALEDSFLKIKESEEKYRLFVESAHEGIWAIDKNAYTTYVNKRMTEILGYSEQEMIGKHLFAFMDKENVEKSKKYLKRREEGIKEQHEFEFLHKNGNKVYTRLETAPLLDEKLEYDGAIAFISDITEHKKAELALINSEKKYRNLVENIPNVIYSTLSNEKRTVIFISDLWKVWTGITPKEHYDDENLWLKVIHPEDRDKIKNQIHENISLKIGYDLEYRVVHNDTGEVFYLRDQGVPIEDEKGNIIRYDGIISNITLRKKFERALTKSESELKERVKEFTCLYQTSGFASEFEKEESDLFNEILEILPSAFQFPEKTYARILFDGNEFTSKNFMLTQWNIKADIKVYDKNLGSIEIYLHDNNSLFLKEEEELTRTIAEIISRFIEHKQAEQKLEQFVSTVSHELRNPIAVLLMSLNYLNKYRENITNEQEYNLMRGIMRNVNLLNELVNDLLMLSRIDEKKMLLNLEVYSPFELISEVLDLMDLNIKSKNIIVELDLKKDLRINGDLNHIKQIFRIFIDNAWKYSEKESKIIIKAVDHYTGQFNPEGIDGILFQIIDYGMGIHEEDLPFIFNRFYRARSVKDIPGTGLGLTIAKELIQLHQGKVYVESEYGNGTTFSIFFPRIP